MLATHKLSEPETLAYHQRSTVKAVVFLRSMMATAIVLPPGKMRNTGYRQRSTVEAGG
jgi:hypothetical protein